MNSIIAVHENRSRKHGRIPSQWMEAAMLPACLLPVRLLTACLLPASLLPAFPPCITTWTGCRHSNYASWLHAGLRSSRRACISHFLKIHIGCSRTVFSHRLVQVSLCHHLYNPDSFLVFPHIPYPTTLFSGTGCRIPRKPPFCYISYLLIVSRTTDLDGILMYIVFPSIIKSVNSFG